MADIEIATVKVLGIGSNGKRYAIHLTGNAIFSQGKWLFVRRVDRWQVEGYSGTVEHPAQGKFYLVSIDVMITLDNPLGDYWPT